MKADLTVRFPVVASAAVFLGFAVIIWLSLLAPGGAIDLFEAGNWLGPASDMLGGKVPYRETYPVHGFLADGGLDYLLFRLFGADLSVSISSRRFLSAFFHPLLFLLTAAATRRPIVAVASIPIQVGFSIATAFDRPVVPLLSLVLFVLALEEKPRRLVSFFAGVTGAIGLLYALDFGTFVLVAEIATLAVAALLIRRWPNVDFGVCYMGGLGIVLLPWFAYLASVGALVQFFRVSFLEIPGYVHSIWGIDFPKPWEIVPLWLRGEKFFVAGVGIGPAIGKRLYLAPLMGLLGLVVAMLAARRRASPSTVLRLVVISFACVLFFRHVLARYHIAVGNALSGPVFVATLAAVNSVWLTRTERGKRIRTWGLFLVGVTAAVGMAGPRRLLAIGESAAAYSARNRAREGLSPLPLPRGGRALLPTDQTAELETLAKFALAHSKPGDYLLDLSNRPALYFFLDRRNPTRFYQSPMMAPYEDEVLRDLQKIPPAFVILTSGTFLDAIDGRSNSTRIPAVWGYVLRHYPVTAKSAGSTIALPAGSPTAGADAPPGDEPQQGSNGARPHSDNRTLR